VKKFLIIIGLSFIAGVVYFAQNNLWAGEDYYGKAKWNLDIDVTTQIDNSNSLTVNLEKFFHDEDNGSFHIFGVVRFDEQLQNYKYINVNCIGLSIGQNLKSERADVYGSMAYLKGIDLDYHKNSYDDWKLVYWVVSSKNLKLEQFMKLVHADSRIFEVNSKDINDMPLAL